ncbi:MAG: hypothetical protein JJE44_13375 [Flavobacteriaceae bacterium]|nr:hypothetical protein [Flavobacteriaceae bacterium]
MSLLTSCFDDETGLELNAEGPNIVTFDRIVDNLTGVAELGGAEYTFLKKIRVVGPTVSELTNDIIVDAEIATGTTADGTMYRINNLPLTLTAENNYLGLLSITITTLGNEPPAEGTPEADTYEAPVLNLKLVATGDANVIASGKIGQYTLNFTPRNPWAGDYDAHVIYRHPTATGGTYPDNIYSEEDIVKTLTGITARKCEVGWFAIWEGEISWITVNSDNTITYLVDSTWPYDVKAGDPNRPDLISHYDPADGKLYLYYHYAGTGGNRIFWEVFTPKF